MLSFEELIQEMSEKTDYKEEEIRKMIDEKQDELSGLVSEEGAAYIVAKELGLDLLEEQVRSLKVKDIVPGMFSFDIKCKIARILDVRTFNRNGNEGAVQNIMLGDESGVLRMSLWNEEIEKFKESGFKEGDCIKLNNIISKEDNLGKAELRLGKRGYIEKIDEDIMLPASASSISFDTSAKEMKIDELKAGTRVIVKGKLIQLFKRKPYYETCAECGGKVEKIDDKVLCKNCGETTLNYTALISGILDDGYGNIRTVFFREDAENILGKTGDDFQKFVRESEDSTTIYDETDNTGRVYQVTGSVKLNDFTGNLELLANNTKIVNIDAEIDNSIKNAEKIREIK